MVQILIEKNDTPESITNKIYQARDQIVRDILVQGTGIICPTEDKPEKGRYDRERVQNRIKNIATRLRWSEMPFLFEIDLYHYLWMTGKM